MALLTLQGTVGWMAWQKYSNTLPPDPTPMTIAGLVLLSASLVGTIILYVDRRRARAGTERQLAGRNDPLACLTVVEAGMITAYVWTSAWPDLLVGLALLIMNWDAPLIAWRAGRTACDAPAEPDSAPHTHSGEAVGPDR